MMQDKMMAKRPRRLVTSNNLIMLAALLVLAMMGFRRPNTEIMTKSNDKTKDQQYLDNLVKDSFAQIDDSVLLYGMLPSEARIIIKASLDYKIDLLLESGTANGVSTELLSRSLPNLEIHTFDLDVYKLHETTKARLQHCCANVTTHIGDSSILIPDFLNGKDNKRIGVVLDGPKAKAARDFAKILLDRHNIYFAAIHDTAPFWHYGSNEIPGTIKETTWEPDYRKKHGHMDERYITALNWTKHAKKVEKVGFGLDMFYKTSP